MSERPNLEVVEETLERVTPEKGFETVAAEILTALDSLEDALEKYRDIPVGGRMIEAANDNELRLAGVHRLIEAVDGLREQYESDRFHAQAIEIIAQRLEALRANYAIDADLANMAGRNAGASRVAEAVAQIEAKIATLSLESAPTNEEVEDREAA